jgi:hypothetical protein
MNKYIKLYNVFLNEKLHHSDEVDKLVDIIINELMNIEYFSISHEKVEYTTIEKYLIKNILYLYKTPNEDIHMIEKKYQKPYLNEIINDGKKIPNSNDISFINNNLIQI